MSEEKWQNVLSAIQEPSCCWTVVRLFHNTARHVHQLVDALVHNTTVTTLHIGDLEADGAAALATYLASPQAVITGLVLQHVADPQTAQLLASG